MTDTLRAKDSTLIKPESEIAHKFKMVVGGVLVIGGGILNALRTKSEGPVIDIMPLKNE